MVEIRIHGRGGQGNVTLAELLAMAAFEDGKFSQAFPFFGSERMGSPVQAFVRIDDKKIRARDQVKKPKYAIFQDYTLAYNPKITGDLDANCVMLLNTDKKPEDLGLKLPAKIVTIPAMKMAMEFLGVPIPNTTLIGAFAGLTGLVSLEAVKKCFKHRFGEELGVKNAKAAEAAYEMMKGGVKV